eukprot:scaffold15929_cov159-Ochromonas_danica.AAC.7
MTRSKRSIETTPDKSMGNKNSSQRSGQSVEPDSLENEGSSMEESSQRSSASGQGSGNAANPSYYAMIKNSYQALVNAIIRPPRCQYSTLQLGPTEFHFVGRNFRRADFHLTNPRNMRLECSWWEPLEPDRPAAALPCVIYMHGNSSARLESLPCLSTVLSLGATLLAFDFSGSGLSEGEYVSLGAFEKDDLAVVIEHLRSTQRVSTIALWGRSMGAATALLHGERDPSIAGMVLDSAFADLTMLAEEIVEKGRQKGLFAPGILVRLVMNFVRSSVQKSAGFDIKKLSPIAHVDACFIPALFVAGENDQFVAPSHSRKLYDKYAGDKNLVRERCTQNIVSVGCHVIFLACMAYNRLPPWRYRQPMSSMMRQGEMSVDEMLALSLLQEAEEEDMMRGDYSAEEEMQRDLHDSLYSLLAGGGSTGGGSGSAGAGYVGTNPSTAPTIARPNVESAASNVEETEASDNDIHSSAAKHQPVLVRAQQALATESPKGMAEREGNTIRDEEEQDWACKACTFINHSIRSEQTENTLVCEMCGSVDC